MKRHRGPRRRRAYVDRGTCGVHAFCLACCTPSSWWIVHFSRSSCFPGSLSGSNERCDSYMIQNDRAKHRLQQAEPIHSYIHGASAPPPSTRRRRCGDSMAEMRASRVATLTVQERRRSRRCPKRQMWVPSPTLQPWSATPWPIAPPLLGSMGPLTSHASRL